MEIEINYEFNNMIYTVVGTHELHQHLQSDARLFEEYVTAHIGSLEMQAPNSTSQDGDSFVWNAARILLLLDEIDKMKLELRNPKIKKRFIWKKIKENMLLKGVPNVTEDIIERKFRNMKNTFKNIKDNKKKTSTGREEIKWEYFDIMDKIFEEDKTINKGHTISSISPPILSAAPEHHPPTADATSEHSPAEASCSDIRGSPTPDESNFNHSGLRTLSASCSGVAGLLTPGGSSLQNTPPSYQKNKQKAERGKQLYTLRKKQLDIEECRLQELTLLRKAIEDSNKIQAERNKLLKDLIEKQK